MTNAAKKLLDQVLALPENDRKWIAERLVDRAPHTTDAIEKSWTDEAVERLERAERGDAELVEYDEVLANVQAALRGK